jgi:peptide/nickel transport system substrate-binding protein
VRVTFTAHDSDFIDVMASPAGRIMQADSIQTIGKDLGTPKGGVMCTGPYKLKKWTPGQDVTIESNPGYWGGEPQVKTVTFVPTQDDANLTAALMAGDLDGAFDIPQASTKQLTASGKGKVYIGPSNSTISLGPVTSKGPAADPRVRRALSRAVDRNALIRSILRGYGAPASTFTVPFQFQGLEQADTFQAAYDKLGSPDVDLKRAKALIKEAGAKDKTLTVLVPSGNQMLLNLATVVKDDAAKVGLKLKIQQRSASEYARFFYSEEARDGVDLIVAVGYQDTPGVNTYATQNAVPGEEGLFNWSKYDNKDVTRLLRSAKSANTTADAAKDFVAAQKIFAPDQLQVTLGVQYARTFMRKGLSGTVTSIAYINTPWAKDLGGTAG